MAREGGQLSANPMRCHRDEGKSHLNAEVQRIAKEWPGCLNRRKLDHLILCSFEPLC